MTFTKTTSTHIPRVAVDRSHERYMNAQNLITRNHIMGPQRMKLQRYFEARYRFNIELGTTEEFATRNAMSALEHRIKTGLR